MKHPESQLQQACVKWFRLQYPKYEKLLYAIPNGGARSKITAAILKGEGVVSGIPDLKLAVPRKEYHGLYIEMKIKGNYPEDNQKEVIALLKQQGYMVEICYTIDEFMKIVNGYLS